MFKNLNIETEHIVLRCFRRDDLPAFHAIVSQPEVMEYLPEDVMDLNEARSILNWLVEAYNVNTPDQIKKFTVAVCLKNCEEIVGWCGLGPLEFDSGQIELYYGISYSEWGKGYATEAADAMLRYGFEVIGLGEIAAVVKKENLSSRRVIEKLSLPYIKEIQNVDSKYKAYEGHLMYSIDREEWDKREY